MTVHFHTWVGKKVKLTRKSGEVISGRYCNPDNKNGVCIETKDGSVVKVPNDDIADYRVLWARGGTYGIEPRPNSSSFTQAAAKREKKPAQKQKANITQEEPMTLQEAFSYLEKSSVSQLVNVLDKLSDEGTTLVPFRESSYGGSVYAYNLNPVMKLMFTFKMSISKEEPVGNVLMTEDGRKVKVCCHYDNVFKLADLGYLKRDSIFTKHELNVAYDFDKVSSEVIRAVESVFFSLPPVVEAHNKIEIPQSIVKSVASVEVCEDCGVSRKSYKGKCKDCHFKMLTVKRAEAKKKKAIEVRPNPKQMTIDKAISLKTVEGLVAYKKSIERMEKEVVEMKKKYAEAKEAILSVL